MANCTNVTLTFVRGYRQYPKRWLKDAVRYEKVKYHPRHPNHADPPIVPSKVLMVHRVKPFKGNPYWEKDILEELGFEEKTKEPVFVKNTPEMCALLWKIKHLVKIVPMQLPEKLPTVDDLTSIYIHENGKFHETGKIDSARYEATMRFQKSPKRLEYRDIMEKLRLLWVRGNLL